MGGGGRRRTEGVRWGRRSSSFSKKKKKTELNIVIMVECCFTSTETVDLLGTGAQDGHLDFHTQLLS